MPEIVLFLGAVALIASGAMAFGILLGRRLERRLAASEDEEVETR